ncbi:Uma2 family endonuclease [Leptolyngbya sp. NK1-12]|uniref:Uma2 family endonuclease n=1 Tax=Leptolyngbya sp. NK1-12 TaxID=2547451 RepID=A0AA96WHU9_9CYAN|nr:Uma2 family endonuclease [Leptolyngbya sp. NK1-12]WNZ22581.1 Uma2 family endonuclease [Leptolyngbya sp. NK1-12]
MNSLLIEKLIRHPELISDDAEQQYIISGVSWQTYEALLSDLGDDFPGLRVHYLEGTLEITMPGRRHEVSKDNISRLLGVYFEESRTRFYGLGSTTFRQEAKRRGAEPDASFCIGTDKAFPDIAIEVVQTHSGINKLSIYQGLGVPEVWFWENGQFQLYRLRSEGYEPIDQSEFLPDLDLALLAAYVQHPEPLDAVLEFRAALRKP